VQAGGAKLGRMIAGLNAGKYDVMDAIVITPERKQVVSFTIPYAATPASFIAVKARCCRRRRGQPHHQA
jgi:octopine/nopaline transport system substrate-binding protein